MAVRLEGGCRVSTMHEGVPEVSGSLKVWNQVGRANEADAISLRILEFGPGSSPALQDRECDEVLYLLEDLEDETADAGCTVLIDGTRYEVEPRTGVYVRPGQTLCVENPGPRAVTFVSSKCPGSNDAVKIDVAPIVRLSDRRALPTADRWYRVLSTVLGLREFLRLGGPRPLRRSAPGPNQTAASAESRHRNSRSPYFPAEMRSVVDRAWIYDRHACILPKC